MRTLALSLTSVLLACAFAATQAARKDSNAIKGWLSDEQCARGRARSGAFTGTDPECAKKCIAEGWKIVLIDPEAKRVLTIQNPGVAQDNIGNYVEVEGTLTSVKSFHIDSLKKLSSGVAECERTVPITR
jgi:hypothetical protein